MLRADPANRINHNFLLIVPVVDDLPRGKILDGFEKSLKTLKPDWEDIFDFFRVGDPFMKLKCDKNLWKLAEILEK